MSKRLGAMGALMIATLSLCGPDAVRAGSDAGTGAGTGFVDRFERPPERAGWRLSNYAHKGGWLDTRWDAARVSSTRSNGLVIALAPDPTGAKAFVSGELRRKRTTHYGRYEVIMQAAAGSGLNSAFFTYTGPHRGAPHDEIDFEFLGRDTTKVALNYYVDGEAKDGAEVDLGFDAAAAPHHYAFEWSAAAIRWYVDGALVHETGPGDAPPPRTPGQIYLSLWAGSPKWLGKAAPDAEAAAIYRCVSFTPEGEEGPGCL